jgi:hypothetical protein
VTTCGRFSTVYLVGILDGIDPHAIYCLLALIEYSFASGFHRNERWRLQVACSCLITVLRVPLLCVRFLSWLIDVTDGYVVSIGAQLAFTHPCYASVVASFTSVFIEAPCRSW